MMYWERYVNPISIRGGEAEEDRQEEQTTSAHTPQFLVNKAQQRSCSPTHLHSGDISSVCKVEKMSSTSPQLEVVIHPLVLLSAADHYYRVAKDTKKRVVGVLLGTKDRNVVDVTNSFAVPFEEDLKNPSVWFLDHNFLETMFWMFKKVNSKRPPSVPLSGLSNSSLHSSRRHCWILFKWSKDS
jgi:hypothetical protein